MGFLLEHGVYSWTMEDMSGTLIGVSPNLTSSFSELLCHLRVTRHTIRLKCDFIATSSQSSVDAIDSWIANSWIAQFTNGQLGQLGPLFLLCQLCQLGQLTDWADNNCITIKQLLIYGKSEIMTDSLTHWLTVPTARRQGKVQKGRADKAERTDSAD